MLKGKELSLFQHNRSSRNLLLICLAAAVVAAMLMTGLCDVLYSDDVCLLKISCHATQL